MKKFTPILAYGVTALAFSACQPSTAKHQPSDMAAINQIAVAIDSAVDDKRWDDATRFFGKEVMVDFTDLAGGVPAKITGQEIVDGWANNLGPTKESFHMRGPGIVRITGNTATLTSKGYAFNKFTAGEVGGTGEPLWEVWGTYTYTLRRRGKAQPGNETNGSANNRRSPWVVTGMTLDVAHQRGNDWVRDTPAP